MHKILVIFSLTIILILTHTATSLSAWQVNIEVSTPDPNSDTGTALNNLSIGTDSMASEGFDNKLDTVALLDGPIQAYVSHPEYQSNQQKLWRDIRRDSLPQDWEFEVKSSGSNNTINLKWKIEAPDNLNFILVDNDSGRDIDMISSSEYSYSNNSTTPKKFLLKVSASQSTGPSTGDQSISGSGGSKGGGCGYLKDAGGKDKDNRRQVVLTVSILLIPLLLPMLYNMRRYAFATTRKSVRGSFKKRRGSE